MRAHTGAASQAGLVPPHRCGWFRQDEPIAAADAPEVSEPVRLSDFVAEEEEAGAKADVDADSSRCVCERYSMQPLARAATPVPVLMRTAFATTSARVERTCEDFVSPGFAPFERELHRSVHSTSSSSSEDKKRKSVPFYLRRRHICAMILPPTAGRTSAVRHWISGL